MTESRDSDSDRWVDGSLESGADEGTSAPAADGSAGGGSGGQGAAGQPGEGEKGVGLTMGPPSTFEPEEDEG